MARIRAIAWFALGFLLAACGPAAEGDRHWKDGEVEAALAAYGDAVALSVVQSQRYARALAAVQRLDEAAPLVASVAESERTGDGWLVIGRIALESGDYDGAVEAFTKGWERSKEPALAVNLCSARIVAGMAAAAVCAEALVAAPDDPAALLGLAVASLGEKNPLVATRALLQLLAGGLATEAQLVEAARLAHSAQNPALSCRLWLASKVNSRAGSSACFASGRKEEGRVILEGIAEGDALAAFDLALDALEQAQNTGPGLELERWLMKLEKWLNLSKETLGGTAAWHNARGVMLDLHGDSVAAERSFRHALSLEPTAFYASLNLARLFDANERAAEARSLMRTRWDAGESDATGAGFALADLLDAAGQRAEAKEIAQTLFMGCGEASATRCLVEASVLLARFALDEGETEAAMGLLEAAVQAGGDDVRERLRDAPEFARIAKEPRMRAALNPGGDQTENSAP